MPVDVPITALNPETLRRLVEEFISREGTDYGHEAYSMDQKVEVVMKQLSKNKAKIVFDEETESFTIAANR